MSWVVPRAWVVGEEATAAKLNEISSALTDLDRRTSPAASVIGSSESTSSATYGDLATPGPAVAVLIGSTSKALVALYGSILVGTSLSLGLISFAISGGLTSAASDTYAVSYQAPANSTSARIGATHLVTGLNGTPSGNSHTFTLKYRVSSGSVTCQDRRVTSTPLGS